MYDGEQFYVQPAHMVEKVKDTMGAGDSFLTVFMDSYIDRSKSGTERPEAIRAALDDAAEFAAMNVSTFDGAFGHGRPYTD